MFHCFAVGFEDVDVFIYVSTNHWFVAIFGFGRHILGETELILTKEIEGEAGDSNLLGL